MTVRDTEDGKIMDWFKERRSRVTNPDGTINLPPEYLMKIRVYRVTQDGREKNWKKKCAYFLHNLGKSLAHVIRCQSSCHTPITFQKYTSAGSGVSALVNGAAGMATSALKGAVSGVIKF
ncbi:major tail tube protein [Escherichia coli]|uniref:Major tail tube protein n=2 Tax=Escherichia coli TaxID=562 RepID=A0A376JVC2_ECOLX|nr:major tail tube protein [Escherichia coli]